MKPINNVIREIDCITITAIQNNNFMRIFPCLAAILVSLMGLVKSEDTAISLAVAFIWLRLLQIVNCAPECV